MELGMNGKHVGQSDVISGCHAGQHGGHVVEQHLDGAESRTSRIRWTRPAVIVAGSWNWRHSSWTT